MAHTLDTTHYIDDDNTTPSFTLAYTCGAGTTVLVAGVLTNSGTRTGGALTYGGTPMTQAGTTEIAIENEVEIWYLLNPSTAGPLGIEVPNSGGHDISMHVASFKAGSGKVSALDQVGQNTQIQANTTNSVTTTVDGAALFEAMGHGYRNLPSANNQSLLRSYDGGSWTHNSQYALQGSLGSITFTWTNDSDDWATILVAFKEVDPPSGWSHNFMSVENAEIGEIQTIAVADIDSVNSVE